MSNFPSGMFDPCDPYGDAGLYDDYGPEDEDDGPCEMDNGLADYDCPQCFDAPDNYPCTVCGRKPRADWTPEDEAFWQSM